ncbi:MAG: DUF1667 domain-containing protein [Clostridia bacterium]|nr:DUF1667 domain-containing protein [Clostridia bacterium]
MKRSLICTVCPRGCEMVAEWGEGVFSVSGNFCPRGRAFAEAECIRPVRTLTAAVPIAGREGEMLSVKTLRPIPKERLLEAAAELYRIRVTPPVRIGDVVAEDLFGSPVVATKNLSVK